MLEGMLATPHVVQSWPKCGNTQLPNSQLMILFNTKVNATSLPSTQKSTQPPCQTGFLVTAWAQEPHSPAGLQGVKTSLWSPLKTTELSQYCVGISCLKLLTPGQGTEVWGDSEVNQGTSPEDCFSTASATTATSATTSGGPTNLMRRSWLLLQYILQPDLIQCFKDLNFIEWLIVYLRWPSEKSISG